MKKECKNLRCLKPFWKHFRGVQNLKPLDQLFGVLPIPIGICSHRTITVHPTTYTQHYTACIIEPISIGAADAARSNWPQGHKSRLADLNRKGTFLIFVHLTFLSKKKCIKMMKIVPKCSKQDMHTSAQLLRSVIFAVGQQAVFAPPPLSEQTASKFGCNLAARCRCARPKQTRDHWQGMSIESSWNKTLKL